MAAFSAATIDCMTQVNIFPMASFGFAMEARDLPRGISYKREGIDDASTGISDRSEIRMQSALPDLDAVH
jgi:hypothetical protein